MLSALASAWLAVIQPAADAPRRAVPEQPIGSYFADADYPSIPLRQGIEGIVAFEAEIGATGRPTRCTVTGSSRSPELDARTCEIVMERMRFSPAMDPAGRPVSDAIRSRVVWRIAELPRLAFARRRLVRTISPGPDGPVCTQTVDGLPADQAGAGKCMDFDADYAQAARAGQTVTFVETTIPEGSADFAAGSANFGALAGRFEIEISVDSSGQVVGCQPLDLRPANPAVDPCADSADMRYQSAEGQERRTARVSVEIYFGTTS